MAERMVSDVLTKPDTALEAALRPAAFAEFTGQALSRERLEIAVEAARRRGEPIDHVLLSGPPGLGKTTLANILAKAMGANIRATSGPTIEKAGDLADPFRPVLTGIPGKPGTNSVSEPNPPQTALPRLYRIRAE